MKKNVLICSEHPALNTGFGNVTDRLVNAVIASGMNPIVLSIRPSPNLDYEKCPVYPCFTKADRVEIMASHLKRIKPSLVISLGDPWDIVQVAENKKVFDFKWIAYTPVEATPYTRFCVVDNKQLDVGRILFLADKIITYSNFGKEAIESMFVKEFPAPVKKDTSRIYLGVDTKTFVKMDKKEARKIFPDLKEDTILFMCNKLDSSRVGYDLLIRSWEKFLSLLKYSRPDLRKRVKLYLHTPLNMVGGTDIPSLLRIVDVGDTVLVNPDLKYGSGVNVETMVSIINAADCYVSCAKGEGFGLPILEATACGIPSIAPDYGCPREFGKGACSFIPIAEYYTPNFSYTNFALVNTDMVAQSMLEIASSFQKRKDMGEAGMKIVKDFDWSTFEQNWIEVIQNNLKDIVLPVKKEEIVHKDKEAVVQKATFDMEEI